MEKLTKLLEKIKYNQEEIESLLNHLINHELNISENENGAIMNVSLFFNESVNIDVLLKLKEINKKYKKINFNYDIQNLKNINKYIIYFLKNHKLKDLLLVIDSQEIQLSNLVKIEYYSEETLIEFKKINDELQNFLKELLNLDSLVIDYIYSDHIENLKIKNQNKEIKIEKIKTIPEIDYTDTYKNFSKNYEERKISELNLSQKYVNLTGKIFSIDIIDAGKKNKILQIGITDDTGNIFIKKFFKKEDDIKELELININDIISANVTLELNAFGNQNNNDIYGSFKTFSVLQKHNIKDDYDSDKKRVEMIVHSKMSAYDGIINLSDLKETLTKYGHKRFAITDRNNVQVFPAIEKTFKGTDIKPIYGVELEVINKHNIGLLNLPEKDQNIDKLPIVIFDLETTGLNPNIDDIIEFGGIRINEDKSITKLDIFIKPRKKISSFTTELTHITNDMLDKDGLSIEEGYKQISEFIKDATLIAHNGVSFDFRFLNTKFIENGYKPISNLMIDTLYISRAINEMQSHTLGKMCAKYKISYNADEAHRADYDAQVLYDCFLSMIFQLKETNISTINELNNFIATSSRNYKAARGYIVNIYAKNQAGLKDLFELVSIAHTKNLISKPVVYWENIETLRKNLLVANNPLESELIDSILNDSDDKIIEKINKYDFILIPTISHFRYHILDNQFDEEDIKSKINHLVDLCLKQNKIICGTSNAYYLEKEDEKFHDLFLKIPGLNKKPHRFSKAKKGPLCFFRTTKELIDEYQFLKRIDLEELVINNPNKISNLIDEDIIITKKDLYPPKIDGVNEKLVAEVYKNAHLTYGEKLPKLVQDELDKELKAIIDNDFSVVYWVSHLLVKKSIEDGYLVGSRGSVGSSLVATFLKITDVNQLPPHYLCKKCKYSNFDVDKNILDGYDLKPMKCPNCNELMYGEGHNIPFETFLGFNCDKVPDIDLNFSGHVQAMAHNFIKEMFGEDKAFRAGTIGTIAEKTSYANARDYFERIGVENFNNADLKRYADKCVDVKRTTGQHPGGVIVVPSDKSIYDFTPINYPADDSSGGWLTTHFAFENIHDNLLKFDILGHDNPTILKMLKDMTGVDPKDIPVYDEKTINLFSDISVIGLKPEDIFNETTGAISLPEFGTKFVREMLKESKPKTFAELIMISGLSHGTDVWIDNAQKLIKEGKRLEEVIGCRDDIMVYLIRNGIDPLVSFQVMEDVRKGKGIKPEHEKILRDNKIPAWYIESANKIKYMFPKAHATAYVIHAWMFAWYKIYYPLEYYAAYFGIRSDTFDIKTICGPIENLKDKILSIKTLLNSKTTMNSVSNKDKDLLPIYEVALEAKLRGIEIDKISIKESEAETFKVVKEKNKIICPFISLDSLGNVVANSIVEARNQKEFSSISDLTTRTKITKKHIQYMKDLNILDDLNESDQLTLFNF